jgi:hypothetical protein
MAGSDNLQAEPHSESTCCCSEDIRLADGLTPVRGQVCSGETKETPSLLSHNFCKTVRGRERLSRNPLETFGLQIRKHLLRISDNQFRGYGSIMNLQGSLHTRISACYRTFVSILLETLIGLLLIARLIVLSLYIAGHRGK